ncbi:MAG: N-acetylmuramidase family protein [Candidatus Thiodiazotropha sp.]
MRIKSSVGNRGANHPSDVMVVQRLLNKHLSSLTPLLPLVEDGNCGPITTGMIIEFQRKVVGLRKPDGRDDPVGKTIDALNKYEKSTTEKAAHLYDALLLSVQAYLKSAHVVNEKKAEKTTSRYLKETDYVKAASLLGVEVATIKAVASVESSGNGFFSNGLPKILFEGHWFSKFSGGKFDAKYPTLSYKKWTKKHYKGGVAEYSRYNSAKALDVDAAMKSTSWGKFQIMGFNYSKCGYSSVSVFVKDMHENEGKQLTAFIKFLKSTKLDVHLKAKNWAAFAKGYNGPAYAKNKYDIRLKQAYKSFSAGG